MANLSNFSPDLLYPLSFIRRARGIPKLSFEEVDPQEIPDPYYSLLVHEGDMTSRLEAFHEDEIKVRKLSSSSDGKAYFREVVLHAENAQKATEYGAIEISEPALDIVSGKRTFESRTYTAAKKLSKPKVEKITTNLSEESSELLQILKKLRYNIAKKRGVPAYVIFPDKTLEQLASLKPTNEVDFLNIDGVGQKKLDQYYDLFTAAIKDYLIVSKVFK